MKCNCLDEVRENIDRIDTDVFKAITKEVLGGKWNSLPDGVIDNFIERME